VLLCANCHRNTELRVETKACTKCNEIKPLNLFRVDSRLKSGRGSQCQKCTAVTALENRNRNVEKARADFRNWRKQNSVKDTKRKLEWARENKERTLEIGRNYYYRNKEARLAKQKEAREKNPEYHRQKTNEWRKNNMGYVLAANALRHANKLKRTPKWLSKEDKAKIKAIYAAARNLTVTTGQQHHVDHIIPLQGKLVSGLHVPNNLQILYWKENLSKKHNYTP